MVVGAGGPARAQPEPWIPAYDAINVRAFRFEHPMTVINAKEIAIVKARIDRHEDPQATAYAALLAEAEAVRKFVPDPPAAMKIMGGYEANSNLPEMRRRLWRNCHAAYTSALVYAYGGEARHADKAVEVLNAWSARGTKFTGGDRGLQLGSWFSPMLYAADLLHDYAGWKPDDRLRFHAWWRRECLPHVYEVMRRRDNNWKDAGVLGVLAAAVALEDRELLRDALIELKSYFHERTDSHVKDKGIWKIKKDERGVYLPREVTRNEGHSGVTYTAYALTTMVQALEIARYAGFDFWHEKTPEGATMRELIEWYFRWSVQSRPFPWHDNPRRIPTGSANPYELLASRFVEPMPEIAAWLAKNRPVNGAQGDEYITLNKGGMRP